MGRRFLNTNGASLFIAAREVVGNEGSGNIVPDTENSTGNSRCRIEVQDRQGRCHSGILHAHFDSDGPGFFRIEAEQFGHEVAEGQSEDVVQDDDDSH